MDYRRALSALLRFVGGLEVLALGAVVMPWEWILIAHRWLGLGDLPHGAVVDYMIRTASFTYGLHGILMWILAADVVKYRALIFWTGVSYVLVGPVFAVIEFNAGMPWFWLAADAGGCLACGAAIIWLSRRLR